MPYTVNLDSATTRAAAEADPDGFIDQYPRGTLAIDEIQRVPKLLLSIKNSLDSNRTPGRFVITGSSNIMRLRGAEESLAGRIQTLSLRGLSHGERNGVTEDFAAMAFSLTPRTGAQLTESTLSRSDYFRLCTTSSYPGLLGLSERQAGLWLDSYFHTVLSKDVSSVAAIRHSDRLPVLLEYFAAQGSMEVVNAHLARALNLSESTIPSYVDALEAVFLIDKLPAWGNNLARRSVSRPKVSLQDSGLAAHIAGLSAESVELDIASASTGGLMESFVASELWKQRTWSSVDYRMFHFRDRDGAEVDLILENRRRHIVGIEVKATTSISRKHFRGLEKLREVLGERFIAGIVLYTGKQALPFGDRLWAMPIASLWEPRLST